MATSTTNNFKRYLKKLYYTPGIQKAAIRTASVFYPPPFRRPNMEFTFGLWQGISAIHCEKGRQLGENNTYPRFFRENIPTNYHKSSIPGSRDGCFINMTTLHMVMGHWEEASALINTLRTHYLQYFNVNTEKLGLLDIFILSKTCVALPAYLARRTSNRVKDGKIPLTIATQYKIVAGIFMIVQKMIERGEPWLKTENEPKADASEIYEYAEQHKLFISEDGKACGGSKRKILELINLTITGNPESNANHESVTKCLNLIGNLDTLFSYAAQAMEVELAILMLRCKTAEPFLSLNPNNNHEESHLRALKAIKTAIANYSPNDMSISGRINSQLIILQKIFKKLGVPADSITPRDSMNTESDIKPQHSLESATTNYINIVDYGKIYFQQKQHQINKILGNKHNKIITSGEIRSKLGVIPEKNLKEISGVNFKKI